MVPLITGFVLLVSGRRLFWLITAILGFVFSYQFAQQHFPQLSTTTLLIVGIVLGIGGAILAVFIQKLAIAIAGFLAGGMAGTYIWELLGQTGDGFIIVFLIAGIIGCLFMMAIFEWTLVILTSLIGAALLVQGFGLEQHNYAGVVYLGLAIFGIMIQSWHSPPKGRRD